MEYELVQFRGVPEYKVRVEKPVGHLYIAVLDLTDRPRENPLLEAPYFGELTAYLCGTGVNSFVYDLRGYNPKDAAERAIGIAVNMKRFRVLERYVGLNMDQTIPGDGLIDSWREHLTLSSMGSVDAAVKDLIIEKGIGRLLL